MISVGDIIEFGGPHFNRAQFPNKDSVVLVMRVVNDEIYDVLSPDGIIDQWAFSSALDVTIYPLADPEAPLGKLSVPQRAFILQLLGCSIPSNSNLD